MRVISGKYKRTPLLALEGYDVTRPTKDMVKEALFSSVEINNETRVLDLFAGSGAIGIEALSRGAKEAVFVDSSKDAVSIIRENLNKVKEDRIVINSDYKDALNKLEGNKFNFVYLDPPYVFDEFETIFELLSKYNLISDKGIIVIEVNKKRELLASYSGFNRYKSKTYGITKLEYYIKSYESVISRNI